MELGDQDGEMGLPLPLPILVGGGYGAPPPPHIHESSKPKSFGGGDNNGASSEENRPPDLAKKAVRYRECLKNHAAGIGGHAIDGCGDFMPSGEDGTLEALKCAACGCHRNFHRREVEGEPPLYYCYSPRKRRAGLLPGAAGVPLIGAPPNGAPLALPSNHQGSNRLAPQMIMALGCSGSSVLSDSDNDINNNNNYMPAFGALGFGSAPPLAKKRFRTKFTAEQKEKMGAFAEKLGWRIQKHDEAAVQQFCADVGVKRHILKVWMHNNKAHLLGKNTA